MTTDTSEAGFEKLICKALTGHDCDPRAGALTPGISGKGWNGGLPEHYDKEYCLDIAQLLVFLRDTQPKIVEAYELEDEDSPLRRKLLTRISSQIDRRGVVDVLRKNIKEGAHEIVLFYATPSPGNDTAKEQFEANRFSITRQLKYSRAQPGLALDMAAFINGLPIATFELKNNLTKQTVADAVQQYKRDRDPHEKLFGIGRCAAHFAVDDNEVNFCTHLRGKDSSFLPFNRGWNAGAGNPPNPDGIRTDYLWREVFTRDSLADILENYAQMLESGGKNNRKQRVQIWPRYHQLDVVRKLLSDIPVNDIGKRYLIQHSAGSGKSNSIAWLAHQLVGLSKNGKTIFDSVIVVTDRKILDRQINDTIKQFAQVGAIVGHAEGSGELRRFIESGKKIIISTVQKFPFILKDIDAQRDKKFAIIIDEAHSSQGGNLSVAINKTLGGEDMSGADEDESVEDKIAAIIEARKMLKNADYFAFTATPKSKTLEIFGFPEKQADGTVKHFPFHSYTMKQAIQERFILDVLLHYTPLDSYYRLIKTVKDDPTFDRKKAAKKLRRYVEFHPRAVSQKAEIMVDHFHRQGIQRRVGGKARAMVVTSSIKMAIAYYDAICSCLVECKSPYKAIVAFSGEHTHNGQVVTEASINGFSSNQIAANIRQDPYRFLICADKFQTGYDEPLLHTMYVDKPLSGIKAVQTLSRLNRAHAGKYDTFVLDFCNSADTIKDAFSDYYQTTILADETDPNKLHDLQASLDGAQVYSPEQVERFVELFLDEAERDQLDPILNDCVERYKTSLGEDGQVKFKGDGKAFLRTYGFLASILPYGDHEWEKRSIFLHFLVPKLPAPVEEDLSRGIIQTIDMESYRIERRDTIHITLPEEDAEIEPTPQEPARHKPEPELDPLSKIIADFNTRFGSIAWTNPDLVIDLITQRIPALVEGNKRYQNARKNSDRENARVEHDKALRGAMLEIMRDNNELYKQFSDNEDFNRWVKSTVFDLTYPQRYKSSPA